MTRFPSTHMSGHVTCVAFWIAVAFAFGAWVAAAKGAAAAAEYESTTHGNRDRVVQSNDGRAGNRHQLTIQTFDAIPISFLRRLRMRVHSGDRGLEHIFASLRTPERSR